MKFNKSWTKTRLRKRLKNKRNTQKTDKRIKLQNDDIKIVLKNKTVNKFKHQKQTQKIKRL